MAGITRVKKNKVPAHIMDWAWNVHQEVSKNCDRFFITATNMHSVTITVCADLKTGKSGVARCHPEDTYNPIVGRAIAYARCRGYAIPRWVTYKKIGEMKNGEKFKFNAGIYTFIGFISGSVYSGSKMYAVFTEKHAYATDSLQTFISFPDEEYEMVE